MKDQNFIALAKRYFARLLNVEECKIDELYEFVNTHFSIKIENSKVFAPEKPQRFSAVLHYLEPGDYGVNRSLIAFGDKELGGEGLNYCEFITESAALEAAYKHVNSVEFLPHNWMFRKGEYPYNMLILFDKDYGKNIG